MFLKSLELYGFKSFADKTHLDFSEGITALLGPNGSGKSNIVNAIQWVLGEQSTKTLRTGRMDDVIFNGTDKRKPMQFAEVTLTIGNENHILASDATEIEIKRRIIRGSGSNEYFLNRQQCNLRDIKSLFMDTGVGKNAYSILAQGKIDEILQQKPEQRRLLFEEAAGISRFKQDTLTAQANLDKTNENIAQVEVILKETHRNYELKKNQAAKAAKARELKQQQFMLEVDVQLNSVRTYRQMQEALRQQLAASQQKLTELQEKIKGDAERLAGLQDEVRSHGARKIDLQIAGKELATKAEGISEQIDLYTSRFRELLLEKKNYEQKAQGLKSQLDMAQENLDEQSDKLEDIDDRLEEVNSRLTENTELLNDAKAKVVLENGQMGEIEQRTLDMQEELTTLQDQLAQLTDVIVVQLDEKLKDSGYSTQAREDAEAAFRAKLASLKDVSVTSSDIAELSGLFDAYVSHVPSFLDELISPTGIISKKHLIDKQTQSLKEQMGGAQQRISSIKKTIEELQGRIEALNQAINNDSVVKADLDARRGGLAQLIETLTQNVNNLKFQYSDILQSGQDSDGKISATQDKIRELEDASQEGREKLSEIQEQMEAEDDAISSLQKEVEGLQAGQSRAVNDINSLRDTVTKSQTNIAALDTQTTEVYNSFFENYGKSLKEYESRLAEDKVEDYNVVRAKLTSVKKELEGMGGINQMAEDEFEDVKKQYEFLTRQMDDLTKSKADLEGVVSNIKQRSADLFMETYKQISQNFQDLYRKLFGGGRAELRLVDEDPAHILETGIDIFAQPPGKKLVNLNALSGGERSMTAVALLFATYMVKASPFCILDEIDAALDDRNIGNFLSVLQGFSEKSQFIIITHNKHTVLGASSMLGVTQMEAGVSTTVSYRLVREEGEPVILDDKNQKIDFTEEGERK